MAVKSKEKTIINFIVVFVFSVVKAKLTDYIPTIKADIICKYNMI